MLLRRFAVLFLALSTLTLYAADTEETATEPSEETATEPSIENTEPTTSAQKKTQIICHAHEEIDPHADFVYFERNDWVQPNGPFEHRCGHYHLPRVRDGHTITFYNGISQVNILEDDAQYNAFWHITLSQQNDSVTLQFKECEGWVIIAQNQNPVIHTLREEPTKYIYVLNPTRAVPGSIGDFVTTVGTDESSPTYSKIASISWGSVSSDVAEPSVEYHHGRLLFIGKDMFVAAGGLRWDATNPAGGSLIDFHQLVSEKAPNRTSTAITTLQDAVHTVNLNPYSNNILATTLGTSGTGSPSDGPGHFIEVIPNLLFPVSPLVVNNFHTIGSDPNELGPSTLEGNTGTQDDWTYDYDINFCTQTLVSTSWGAPYSFDPGFDPARPYGRAIRVYKLELPGTGTSFPLVKRFQCNPVPQLAAPGVIPGEGTIPLEVRRVHMPAVEKYFVGVALPGAIDFIYLDGNEWKKRTIVTPNQLLADVAAINAAAGSSIPGGSPTFEAVPSLKVPLVTDITLSDDDRYLYVSCWLAGAVVRYDIQKLMVDPEASVHRKGGIGNLGGITAINGAMPFNNNTARIQGIPFNGGPQMLRISADGQTLYVTNSLYSSWDDQFFPAGIGSIRLNGGKLIKINTGAINGEIEAPMTIDQSFLIDFKNVTWPNSSGVTTTFTARAHECYIKKSKDMKH